MKNKTTEQEPKRRGTSALTRLLCCPFCGGEAALNTMRTTCKQTIKLNGQDTFHGVNCIRCGADNKGLLGYRTKEKAIKNWNKRHESINDPKDFRVVYIAHPIKNDIEGNLKKIEEIGAKINAQEPDVVPFVPYFFDCQVLNDEIPEERSRGIKNNLVLIKKGFIDEMRLYGSKISGGMKNEIELAHELGIKIAPMTSQTRVSYRAYYDKAT